MELLLEHPEAEVREAAQTLLEGLDGIHRPALVRLANLLDHHGLLNTAAGDPVIGPVLDLYDLAPVSPTAQVEHALEDVRAYIQSHGGQVEVLAVEDGVVRLRLAGSCSGCSGSAMTLKRGVETALREGFPGFKTMAVEEPEPEPPRPTFIALGQIGKLAAPVRPLFEDAAAVADVSGMMTVRVGSEEVLLHNVAGEIYAFRKGGDQVQAFPVAIEEGRVKVAVNVPALAPVPGAAR